ncbi:hypothetical protein DPMN_062233 [Dreissena polymorpha]|uniref:Uncharacterized protein n=1 Tax=Dreissena polymorpha TaxID=45954 RepID=A0A9D4C997_DREPO|nr:hypothetical protein DPMN_062233 [Dreissena polymorpha]
MSVFPFSAQDGTYYADRVVTFTGPLDNCKKGLEMVFEKMRKCAELDQQNFQVLWAGLYNH